MAPPSASDATLRTDPPAAAGTKPWPAPAPMPITTPPATDTLAAAVEAYTSTDHMILAPILPAGAIAWFHGPRGIGLTNVMVSCADAIASGYSFLDWIPQRPVTVLLVTGTMSEIALRARLRAAAVNAASIARRDERLRLVALGPDRAAVPDLATAAGREALAVLAEACDVIMIDDLAGLLPGNRVADEAGLWHWLGEQRRLGKTLIVSQASGRTARRRAEVAARNVLERLADVVVRLAPVARARPHEGVNFELQIERAWHVSTADRAGFEVSVETDATGAHWYLQPIEFSRRERFDAMRATGMPVGEAARQTGTPSSTAYRWAHEARVEARKKEKERSAAAYDRIMALAALADGGPADENVAASEQ
jgi:hypothetical protein